MPSPSDAAVALLIAAYKAEATLERAVRSALAEPEVAEVIVIDDASPDATAALARALAAEDARVRVIALPANAGPATARNAGLSAASAPWIGILDADDYLLPGRTAALLAQAGGADFIADALIRTPLGAAPVAPTRSGAAPIALDFTRFVEGNLGRTTGPLDLGFIKPLMRRSFLVEHKLRYRDMRLGEDYELYARALALGARFLIGEAAGYISVERPGSLSKEHSERDLQLLRDCDDDLGAIRAFTPAEQRALERHRTSVDCRLQWRRLITAVKAKDAGAALSTFHTPATAAYLAAQLGEQLWLRSTGRGPKRAAATP